MTAVEAFYNGLERAHVKAIADLATTPRWRFYRRRALRAQIAVLEHQLIMHAAYMDQRAIRAALKLEE